MAKSKSGSKKPAPKKTPKNPPSANAGGGFGKSKPMKKK